MQKEPTAERREHAFTHHGVTIQDPYAWLKDPGYPEVTDSDVIQYLQAENQHFEAHMQPLSNLVDVLFEEIKARQPAEDESVPYLKNGRLNLQKWELLMPSNLLTSTATAARK